MTPASSSSLAATWLAFGLDPARTLLYRQSDVPEVYELSWLLACMTPKGWMNKAHAYKAARDANVAATSSVSRRSSSGSRTLVSACPSAMK